LAPIEHEANVNEAQLRLEHSRRKLADVQKPPPLPKQTTKKDDDDLIGKELADIDSMVQTLFANNRKIKDLKRNPQFLELSQKQQKAVFKRIKERLNPSEIDPRREMRGS
jgi:small-conductance mechanosensitive channel